MHLRHVDIQHYIINNHMQCTCWLDSVKQTSPIVHQLPHPLPNRCHTHPLSTSCSTHSPTAATPTHCPPVAPPTPQQAAPPTPCPPVAPWPISAVPQEWWHQSWWRSLGSSDTKEWAARHEMQSAAACRHALGVNEPAMHHPVQHIHAHTCTHTQRVIVYMESLRQTLEALTVMEMV